MRVPTICSLSGLQGLSWSGCGERAEGSQLVSLFFLFLIALHNSKVKDEKMLEDEMEGEILINFLKYYPANTIQIIFLGN